MKAILPENMSFSLFLLNRQACMTWLIRELYPAGLRCPKCEAEQDSAKLAALTYTLKDIRCRECGNRFGVYQGTIFSGTRLRPEQLVLMLHLFAFGRRDPEIAQHVGVTRSTINRWRKTLRAAGSRAV